MVGTSNMPSVVSLSPSQCALVARAHLRQFTPFAHSNNNGTVIVFPEYKIAYVPVPKCANSSIRAALLPLVGISPDTVSRIQEFEGFQTTTMADFVGRRYARDWFVFTVVRNPYSRYASAYLDKLETRSEPLRPLKRMGLKKGDSFGLFMKMISKWPSAAINEHFAPQTTILARPLRLPELNIHKVENLDADWRRIAERIEAKSGIALPDLETRNAGKAAVDWKSLYDAETVALARRLAARDFVRFEYSTDLPE